MSFNISHATFVFLASSSALLSGSSFAALATPVAGEKKIESVTVSKMVTLKLAGKDVTMVPVARALRRKKAVGLFWAKVYVTEVFSPSADALDRTNGEAFVDSLLAKNQVGIRLAFVRNISPSQTLDGLKDGLKANGVDVKSPAMDPFYTAITKAGENQDGKSLWVAASRDAAGSESVVIEGTSGEPQTVTLEKGTLRKMLLIWFGVPADKGIEEAKVELLKAPS